MELNDAKQALEESIKTLVEATKDPIAEDKTFTYQKKYEPSAEDLDAVAAEQKIADATAPLQTNEPTDEQVLDAALAAQGDEEVVELPEASPSEARIWEAIHVMNGRIKLLEARIEDHNARSGHKI